MKRIILSLVMLTSLNAMALEFSVLPPAGFDYPDFREFEQASKDFVKTVEKLRATDKVQNVVSSVEEKYNTTCVEINKESRGFKYYKLPYLCEGESNFKLVVKARYKKGNVVVKGYEIK